MVIGIIVVVIAILLFLLNLTFHIYQYPAEMHGSTWGRRLWRAEEYVEWSLWGLFGSGSVCDEGQII